MSIAALIRGSCLCGAVAYQVEPVFDEVHHCHCTHCRKSHGAAHSTYGAARRVGFRFTAGAERVRTYRSSPAASRTFCGDCGSNLQFFHEAAPDTLWIALGTLDDDPGARPQAHMFVRSRAPWHDITDRLPQHDGYLQPADPGGDPSD